MKILTVSLLRLGDIIQQKPLLEGLRRQFPEAEIHLLLNRQFSQVETLVGDLVQKFIYFDRDILQKSIGEANFNFMWSYDELAKLIDGLNQEQYDCVYNFTHTRLSAYMIGAVQCPDKQGLYYAEGKFQGLQNPWLKYFNNRFSGQGKSLFQYAELLGHSFAIPVEKSPARAPAKKKKKILFQCLTSDLKKNWGLENFRALKSEIERSLVDYQVQILSAPFEKEKLMTVFREDEIIVADLRDVKALCAEADLLVTGDTSIKHLAAQESLPTLEIALGGSDPLKTGAYAENAWVLQSSVPCAPCVHSRACNQPTQACAEDITPDQVFESVWRALSQDRPQAFDLELELNRAAWTSYLDQSMTNPLLAKANSLSPADLESSQRRTKEMKAWAVRIENILPKSADAYAGNSLSSLVGAEFVACAQEIMRSGIDRGGIFQIYLEALTLKFQTPQQIYTRVAKALDEIKELLSLREVYANDLSASVLKEGEYYAKGIGQLSVDSFEEARESLPRRHKDASL